MPSVDELLRCRDRPVRVALVFHPVQWHKVSDDDATIAQVHIPLDPERL